MYILNSIQYVNLNPGIWTSLLISISSLGIYYSIILVVRDRGRGRQRTMIGLYSMSISILLLHLLILLHWNGLFEGWIGITGAVMLFLIGPFSYRMMLEQSMHRTWTRNLIFLVPAVLILACMLFALIPDSIVYAIGIIHTGLYLLFQTLGLARRGLSSVHLCWNHWYTATQIFLYLGIGISCLVLPAMSRCFLASAGLALLILLIWIRLIYIAYLSYVISRS